MRPSYVMMEVPVLVRWCLYIEMVPCSVKCIVTHRYIYQRPYQNVIVNLLIFCLVIDATILDEIWYSFLVYTKTALSQHLQSIDDNHNCVLFIKSDNQNCVWFIKFDNHNYVSFIKSYVIVCAVCISIFFLSFTLICSVTGPVITNDW